MGNHTETLEVDFDPQKLSFPEVVELFWKGHNPFAAPRSRQYMSVLFWRDAAQRDYAEDAAARISGANGGTEMTTRIAAFDGFYLSEDYHQKYRLRRHNEFEAPLRAVYPDFMNFVNSTAVARLNGYLGGNGAREAVDHDLPLLGLSSGDQERLRAILYR